MVDSISNSAISTLIRAQSSGLSGGVSPLKGNAKATNSIISQLQETLDDKKPQASRNIQRTDNTSSLPRGSLVNLLV